METTSAQYNKLLSEIFQWLSGVNDIIKIPYYSEIKLPPQYSIFNFINTRCKLESSF